VDESVVGVSRPAPVAGPIEQGEQPSESDFSERRELHAPSGEVCSQREPAGLLLAIGERPGGDRSAFPEASPFGLQPFVEAGRMGNEEAREEGAAVEVEGLPMVGRVDGLVEIRGVAGKPGEVEADLVPIAQEHTISEHLPQEINGAVERSSRPFLVVVAPEEGEEPVSSLEAVRVGDCEMHEEGNPPGLRKNPT
jgi:hypothetical protein